MLLPFVADDAEVHEIEELRKALQPNRTCRYFGDDEGAFESKFNSHEDKTFRYFAKIIKEVCN